MNLKEVRKREGKTACSSTSPLSNVENKVLESILHRAGSGATSVLDPGIGFNDTAGTRI